MKSKESRIKQCYDVGDEELKIINYFYSLLLETSLKKGFKEVELTSFEEKDKFEKVASVVPSKIFNVVRPKEQSIYVLKSDIAISTGRFISELSSIPILKFIEISKLYRDRVDNIKGYRREFKQILLSSWGSNNLFYDAELLSIVNEVLENSGLVGDTYTQISNQNIYNCLEDGLASRIRFNGIEELRNTDISVSDYNLLRQIYYDNNNFNSEELRNLINDLNSEKVRIELENMLKVFDNLCMLQYSSPVIYSLNNLDGTNHYSGMNYRIYVNKDGGAYLLVDGGRIDTMVEKFNPNLKIPGVCLGIGAQILSQNVSLPNKDKNINIIVDEDELSNNYDLIQNIIMEFSDYNVCVIPYNLKKMRKFYKSDFYDDCDYIIISDDKIDVRCAIKDDKENLSQKVMKLYR